MAKDENSAVISNAMCARSGELRATRGQELTI